MANNKLVETDPDKQHLIILVGSDDEEEFEVEF